MSKNKQDALAKGPNKKRISQKQIRMSSFQQGPDSGRKRRRFGFLNNGTSEKLGIDHTLEFSDVQTMRVVEVFVTNDLHDDAARDANERTDLPQLVDRDGRFLDVSDFLAPGNPRQVTRAVDFLGEHGSARDIQTFADDADRDSRRIDDTVEALIVLHEAKHVRLAVGSKLRILARNSETKGKYVNCI